VSELAEIVRGLEAMNIDALREEWRRRLNEPPPPLRAADLMRRCLADRLQVEAVGADADLDRQLGKLVRAYLRGEKPTPARARFQSGTLLEREHEGRVHRVEVLEAGFRYDGRTWKSLSQIARAITGVRWNGPRFFGLREGAGA